MNTEPSTPDDPSLHRLLQTARPAPALPPRFQEGVWRRIERATVPAPAVPLTWLERWLQTVLSPRIAFVALAVVLLGGGVAGAANGASQARELARLRYVATVSPAHQP